MRGMTFLQRLRSGSASTSVRFGRLRPITAADKLMRLWAVERPHDDDLQSRHHHLQASNV